MLQRFSYGYKIYGIIRRMKLYRFSPITTEEGLLDAIRHVHIECHRLCKASFGEYLPVAGNMGIFCHYDDEYAFLTGLRKKLTEESDNLNQKYYRLHKPMVIAGEGDIPAATYTHLYIRQPDIYRAQVGDIDFVMEPARYEAEKANPPKGSRVFPRADLDMIELYDYDVDALGYVSTHYMAEKVRTKTAEA